MSKIEYDQEIRDEIRKEMQNDLGFVHEVLLDLFTLHRMIEREIEKQISDDLQSDCLAE